MSEARNIKARIATNDDAEALELLAESNKFEFDGFEIDWTDIWPFWIVAELHGEIIGAVNTCPSKPVGRIEFLLLEPGLEQRERAIAVKLLISVAESLLRQQGSQLSAGTIPDSLQGYQEIAKNRGWVNVDEGGGRLWMRRLV